MDKDQRTFALENFVAFSKELAMRDGFVLHRDHWNKNFRVAFEECEKLGIRGASEFAALEKQSCELAEKAYCDQRKPGIFSVVSFLVRGCNCLEYFPRCICEERKAGAFAPSRVPHESRPDEANNKPESVQSLADAHDLSNV